MYQAMRETRPHRRAIPREEIAATLEKEAERGRLDREAVRAVLETAGHRVERGRARGAATAATRAGLTDREIEVLRLVSRGLTDKEVGAEAGDLRRARWATTWPTPTRRSASRRAPARRCSR